MNTLASGYSIGGYGTRNAMRGKATASASPSARPTPCQNMEHRMGTRRRRGLGEVQRIPLPGMRRLPGQKTRMVSDTFTCGVEHDISFLNVRSYEKRNIPVILLLPLLSLSCSLSHKMERSISKVGLSQAGKRPAPDTTCYSVPEKSPGRTVREWNILSPWPNVTALRVKR